MRKIFTLVLILGTCHLCLKAQNSTTPPVKQASVKYDQPYGIIDTADLTLKQCDFEKDANAEVLIDKGDETFDEFFDITYVVHKRIKIFNDNGKYQANIQIPFIDRVVDIRAETVNLVGKTITYTPVDVNLIYKQKIASKLKKLAFTFPDVRAGSVIEMQYKWKIHSMVLPPWYFQENIPTRYSEIGISFKGNDPFSMEFNNRQPFVKDTLIMLNGKDYRLGKKYVRAMANVPSFKDEPYMAQESAKKQRLLLKFHADYWGRVFGIFKNDENFGGQLSAELFGEAKFMPRIDSIKDKYARADSIFNLVQKRMSWNRINARYTTDGIEEAWLRRSGNSTEINLILYKLLSEANVQAYPMVVSTVENGYVDPEYASPEQFNKTVVIMPVDSVNYYILDASDKHNVYNVIPYDLLSNYGFAMDLKTYNNYKTLRISGVNPSSQLVHVKATIQPDGKMSGEANIASDSYNRNACLKLYNKLGEKKYIDVLSDNDNNLKISSLKLDSAEQDSLPLTQELRFDMTLTSSDENYIYFNPNLFSSFGKNPFLDKDRVSDIDFMFNNSYIISGEYTIPQGYKIDVLPANRNIIMEDKSISFKRVVGEQDGRILVRYVIKRTRSYYQQNEYSGLYNFYKEMYEALNEQVVLKKI